MTATLPRGGLRTEAQLIRALANEIRQRPYRDFEDALHQVMHGESSDRWHNFVAAVGLDLHTKPMSKWDRDELPVRCGCKNPKVPKVGPRKCGTCGAEVRADHPACYAERVRIWAAQIGDPVAVAAALDMLADQEERELVCIDEHQRRARVGGRAHLWRTGGAR